MPHRGFGLILICAGCFPLANALGVEAVSMPLKERPKGKSAHYGPAQATGEPDILAAGDNPQAWTPQQPDGGIEWLALEFEKAVRIESVRIRETNNPGCVTKVVAVVEDEKEVALFEGEDPSAEAPIDLVIEPGNDVRSKSIKIYIDTRLKPGWEQIDAVELVGKDGKRQWAATASASSSYGSPQGSQDELNALRGRKVFVTLESGKAVGGELVRVSARWIVLKASGRERLINRDRIEVVELERDSKK